MEYQVGAIGRVVLMHFEDGDDVLEELRHVAKTETIRAGVLYALGGIKRGRVVVGPESDEMPPRPIWKDIQESHEVVAIGTVFWENDEPKIHLHGAFGKRDVVTVGCLREDSRAFLVLEMLLVELTGINAVRELDPNIGMSLLKLIR